MILTDYFFVRWRFFPWHFSEHPFNIRNLSRNRTKYNKQRYNESWSNCNFKFSTRPFIKKSLEWNYLPIESITCHDWRNSVCLRPNTDAYSEPCQISKMEDFTKIVNSFQSLIISAKLSILDVDWVLNTSLAPAILNWIAKILDIPIRYHGSFPSFYPYNSTIWPNFCFIWFFSSNHTERLGYHESTHKLVKVYITLCNNIMALETRVTSSNLNVIPVYPS